jgi:hypothetical protein
MKWPAEYFSTPETIVSFPPATVEGCRSRSEFVSVGGGFAEKSSRPEIDRRR